MNPAIEVDRLLEQSGAVLIRQNKHYVYKLPNGKSFVRSKTPSDHRAAHNSLQDLRRMLGVAVVKETTQAVQASEMTTAPAAAVPPALQQPIPTPTPEPPPPPPPPPPAAATLADRLAAAVTAAEEEQEQYLLAAQVAERKVHMLKALEPFIGDQPIEHTLRALLGAPKPPSPPSPVVKAATVAAPQQARQSPTPFPVFVTRDLVFEVAKRLGADNNAFTTVQITEIMIGDQKVSPKDRTRIMASISHAVTVLGDRGLLQLHEKGWGKKPALWLLPGPVKAKVVKAETDSSDPQPNAPKVNGVKMLRTHRTQ